MSKIYIFDDEHEKLQIIIFRLTHHIFLENKINKIFFNILLYGNEVINERKT